jgi:hypothetical protein
METQSKHDRTNLDFEKMLRTIQQKQDALLDHINLDDKIAHFQTSVNQGNKPDYIKVLIFAKHYLYQSDKMLIETRPPVKYLFEVLESVQRIVTPEPADSAEDLAFKQFEICFYEAFLFALGEVCGDYTDEEMSYREEVFTQRNALPKSNVFRKVFVEAYLDEEVYFRHYSERKTETEGEDAGEKYTPEGAKEWDCYFNDLCLEYGEEEYQRTYSTPEEVYPDVGPEEKLYNKRVIQFTSELIRSQKAFFGPDFDEAEEITETKAGDPAEAENKPPETEATP